MQKDDSQNKLTEAFQLDKMSEAERDAFMVQAGGVIFDAAIGRLLLSLNEEEAKQFESYVDSIDDNTDLIKHLFETYQNFEKILQEEAGALKAEAERVVS